MSGEFLITTLKLISRTTQEKGRLGELVSTSFADPSFDRGKKRTYLLKPKYLSDLRAAQRQFLLSDTVDNGFVQSIEKLTMKDNSEAFFNHGLFKMHAHAGSLSAPPICGSLKDNPLSADMTTFGSSEHLRIMTTSDLCNLSTKQPNPRKVLFSENTTTIAANGYQVSFTLPHELVSRLSIRNMCSLEQWSLYSPFHISIKVSKQDHI